MSDFCDLEPKDPSCQAQETTMDNRGDHGHEGSHDEWGHMEKMGRMEEQMTWEEVDEQLDEWLNPSSGFTT